MNASQYERYRSTPLWRAVADIVQRLESSGEVKVETAPEYVIGFVCQELAAKWVVAASALGSDGRS